MGFINDNDVPPGLFEECPVLHVLLEGVHRNDGPVVMVEGVHAGGKAGVDPLYPRGVEADQGYRKPAPELFLELGHHALDRNDEDPPAPPPADQF
ncbi:hypothetical protein SDC9_186929 [bioreactor metagenome]|uniref:Uncharacterized protein n=1 Tax=bioreactor metagenome TaxID=1076179 RepID=A0A645HK57_9ZZZZ